MMVSVDISGGSAKTEAGIKRIEKLPFQALAIAKNAGKREQRESTYRNRTGVLRGDTGAELYGGHLGFRIRLHQGAFYGVFVQARGYSDFEGVVYDVDWELDRLFRG